MGSNLVRKPLYCLLLVFAVAGLHICRPAPARACSWSEPSYHYAIGYYNDLGDGWTLKYLMDSCDVNSLAGGDRVTEYLFLYPFKLKYGEEYDVDLVWDMAYNSEYGEHASGCYNTSYPAPQLDKLDAALSAGDLPAAEKEAKAVADYVLDLPSRVACNYQREFVRALEVLELAPYLNESELPALKALVYGVQPDNDISALPAAVRDVLAVRGLDRSKVDEFISQNPGNPRLPTLKFVSLQERFKKEIPDGWMREIRKLVPEETWQKYEREADDWLNKYHDHPLYDLVVFWKVRLYHLQGRDGLAWKTVMSVYPERLLRTLYEMRFLAKETGYSSSGLIDSVEDPVLLSALIPYAQYSPERWSRWWRISERNMPEPWAINMQERLLSTVIHEVDDSGFPEGFPETPDNPTQLWGMFRALALMNGGKLEEAEAQALSLKPGNQKQRILEQVYLRQNRLVEAAKLHGRGGYLLIWVLLDENGLSELESSGDEKLRNAALTSHGMRLASEGRWAEGAELIKGIDPERAKLWRETAELAKNGSQEGILKYARFLKKHAGKLYVPLDFWYTNLSHRYDTEMYERPEKYRFNFSDDTAELMPRFPGWHSPWSYRYEMAAVQRYLLATSAYWPALQAYIKWLENAKPSAEMRKVVTEADFCYNKLINISTLSNDFWSIYLSGLSPNTYYTENRKAVPPHPVVVKLREAGRRTKGK